jgi:hypothetical protein
LCYGFPDEEDVMTKLTCPWCEKPAISVLRKMWLGPALSTKCRNCGRPIGVPYTSMLALIPFIGLGGLGVDTPDIVPKVAMISAGFALMCALHIYWVPLERR